MYRRLGKHLLTPKLGTGVVRATTWLRAAAGAKPTATKCEGTGPQVSFEFQPRVRSKCMPATVTMPLGLWACRNLKAAALTN